MDKNLMKNKNAPEAATSKGTKQNNHIYCKGEKEKKQGV